MRLQNSHLASLVALMALLLLVLATSHFSVQALQQPSPTPSPAPSRIAGPLITSLTHPPRREIAPRLPAPGEQAVVDLLIEGIEDDNCRGVPQNPVDLFIVFDISASAGTGPRSNWERTVEIAKGTVDVVSRPIYASPSLPPDFSTIGLISSQISTEGPVPLLLQPLSADYNAVAAAIDAIAPGGDTDLAAGVRLAAENLRDVRDPTRTAAILLMLHDGTAINQSLVNAVNEVQLEDFPVYILANPRNIAEEDRVTTDDAEDLVARSRFLPDPADPELYNLFLALTEARDDLAAAAVSVSESINPPEHARLANASGPNARIEDGVVHWDDDVIIFGEEVLLRYRLTIAPAGVRLQSSMQWLDCNGYPQQITDESIEIALAPTATPTATVTPVAPELEIETSPDVAVIATATPTRPSASADDRAGDDPPPEVPDLPDFELPDAPNIPTPTLPGGGLFSSLLAFLSQYWWVLLLLLLAALLLLLLLRLRPAMPAPARTPVAQPPSPPAAPLTPPRAPAAPSGRNITQHWGTVLAGDEVREPVRLFIQPSLADLERRLAKPEPVTATIMAKLAGDDANASAADLQLSKTLETDAIGRQRERIRAQLLTVDVHRTHRNIGLTKLLLRRAEQLASEVGAEELWVAKPDERLREVLLQAGYEVESDKETFVKRLAPRGTQGETQ